MSEQFARWIASLSQRIAESPVTSDGQGSETSVFATFTWPGWLAVMVMLGCTAWFAWNYKRERGAVAFWLRSLLVALRCTAVLLILFMLQGWMIQEHRTDLPDLVIMLDVSSSMATRDVQEDSSLAATIARRLTATGLDEATRLNLAKLVLLEDHSKELKQLRERYRLKVFTAGTTTRQLTRSDTSPQASPLAGDESIRQLTATDDVSRLGRAVRDVLEAQRGRPTSAIVFITDGINTDGRSLVDAAELARRKLIPLHLIGIGNERPPRDAQLADLLVDPQVFVNDLVTFDLKLVASGYPGKALKVVLRQKGSSEILAEETLAIGEQQEVRSLRLAHRPTKIGQWEYELAIEGNVGDVNAENDRLVAKVTVHNPTLRVLLVQGAPSFEFRFLKTMLERELNPQDEGVAGNRAFQVMLQDADIQFADTDKSALRHFPISREELFSYDVLLIGDANPALFSQGIMQNIVDFVQERGGSVVFIAGPRFNPLTYRDTPLAKLLPIDVATIRLPDPDADLVEEMHPRPTPLGLASPPMQLVDSPSENLKIWSEQLPGIYWWVETPNLRPGARVLLAHATKSGAEGTPLPMVSLQFVGAGKVVFQAFDGSYRWRYRVGDRYFSRYWIQMIRYLSRSKVVGKDRAAELTTDRDEYLRGESVLARVKFLDDRKAPASDSGVSLLLEQPGSPRQTITANRVSDSRGVFEATITNLAEGNYRMWLVAPPLEGEAPSHEFRVVAPRGEQARLELASKELSEAAKISGGAFVRWPEAIQLLAQLPAGRQVRVEALPPRPIWNSPILAAMFVCLLVAEWLVRKKVGML